MAYWDQVFNSQGNFLMDGYDPFRPEEGCEFHDLVFDEDGDLKWDTTQTLQEFIATNNCSWASDIVKLYYAEQFSGNTKGNYSTVYAWR